MKRFSALFILALGATLASAPMRAEETRPAGFVDAVDLVPGLALDIRYAGADNFVGRRISGYEAARCLLTQRAAEALGRVQADLAVSGHGLKAFDCYRPSRAVAYFADGAKNVGDASRKSAFYPEIDKRDLFRLGYVARHSAHSRGSAIDLTLIDRGSGQALDMGSPFDFMGPISAFQHPAITAEQFANRLKLRGAMERHGFRAYEKEWWHFNLRDEPFPNRYFNFPVR